MTLIYDLEIIKAIPPRDEADRLPDIEYVSDWHDHQEMGVSVIGAIELESGRSRVFCEDNFDEFAELAEIHGVLVGFNNIPFDNAVLRASGIVDIPEGKCYDLLKETWSAAGLGPSFEYPSHAGYGLDAVCERNGLGKKSGHGALAPVDWQRGNIGAVIDYCLQDCNITAKLFQLAMTSPLISPKDGSYLTLERVGDWA